MRLVKDFLKNYVQDKAAQKILLDMYKIGLQKEVDREELSALILDLEDCKWTPMYSNYTDVELAAEALTIVCPSIDWDYHYCCLDSMLLYRNNSVDSNKVEFPDVKDIASESETLAWDTLIKVVNNANYNAILSRDSEYGSATYEPRWCLEYQLPNGEEQLHIFKSEQEVISNIEKIFPEWSLSPEKKLELKKSRQKKMFDSLFSAE